MGIDMLVLVLSNTVAIGQAVGALQAEIGNSLLVRLYTFRQKDSTPFLRLDDIVQRVL